MRQILLTGKGAVVARMPRPALGPGDVLVRTRYSLISAGTELAGLRASTDPSDSGFVAQATAARRLLGRAVRDPRKAGRRVATLVRGRVRAAVPAAPAVTSVAPVSAGPLRWDTAGGAKVSDAGGLLEVVTDDAPDGYQLLAQPVAVPPGHVAVIDASGRSDGPIVVGLLDADRAAWVGSVVVGAGEFVERLVFDPAGSPSVTAVVANGGAPNLHLAIERSVLEVVPAESGGWRASELDQVGGNVGYSAVGEVLAVGADVTDLSPGDVVACAGAGQANHAEFLSMKRNLVCRVPPGCDLQSAATATVGAIALQGVRRAAPQLGDRVCVIGLGLIGQLTAQLLRASGCYVIGLDMNAERVERAKALGVDVGASDPDSVRRAVVDATAGHGVDTTVITASTRTSDVINLAMELTRRKGKVVVVGDVGLGVERAAFYRKEIDLLMSTSYGPGRYDPSYEERGQDYPYGYVRWTLNRNMQAYLEQIAAGRVDVAALIDRVVPIGEAGDVYAALASAGGDAPLGVLIEYGDESAPPGEPADATRITLRGHRPVREGPLRCAIVGSGAFAQGMLVPQLAKRRDRFQLWGVVSRDTARGGNFARQHGMPVFATELDRVLDDPDCDLVVIATRHHEHADQVIRSLRAGKHVFVEKPLAITWDQLDTVVEVVESLEDAPALMVGFNRRFAPAMQALASELRERRTPLVVNYRVNAGYIPLDSWIQGPEGGGRNLGEACHMYDVFRFLAGSPVVSIAATAIDPGPSAPYANTDNFCATLQYGDGTLANLVYTALGPKQGMGKERIEVFCGGEAYVIDDFRTLTRSGETLWESDEVDKGHAEELGRLGDAIASGASTPIPVADLLETSAVALHIEDLLRS